MTRGKEPREMGIEMVVADEFSFHFYSQNKTFTEYDQTGLGNHRIQKLHLVCLGIWKQIKYTSTSGGEGKGAKAFAFCIKLNNGLAVQAKESTSFL